MQYIAAILASLALLTGNQVLDLDFQTFQLGRSRYPEFATFHQGAQFKNANQATNYAILCATLDWDATRMLPAAITNEQQLRIYGQYYISVPAAPNQLKFLNLYADRWQTNWQAGPVEDGMLRRLAIQNPKAAADFFDKLVAKPENLPFVKRYHWNLLKTDRRKAEAAQYEQENHLDTSCSASSQFQLVPGLPPTLQVLWPRMTRLDCYTYSFAQQLWADKIIAPSTKPVMRWKNWHIPSKEGYCRSWQAGPSWQITYSCSSNVVVRTATYIEKNSYVMGTILPRGFREQIIEQTQAPSSLVRLAPYFTEVNP